MLCFPACVALYCVSALDLCVLTVMYSVLHACMHVLCIALDILCVVYKKYYVCLWLHGIESSVFCVLYVLMLCPQYKFPVSTVLSPLDLAVFSVLQFVLKMLSVLFSLCWSVFPVLYCVLSIAGHSACFSAPWCASTLGFLCCDVLKICVHVLSILKSLFSDYIRYIQFSVTLCYLRSCSESLYWS